MSNFSDMDNVFIMDHPLIQHKISRLRDKNTGTAEFRALVEEIAMLMGYEALKDLPLEDVEVETPIETCMTPQIAGKKFAIVPILRAGGGEYRRYHRGAEGRGYYPGGDSGKEPPGRDIRLYTAHPLSLLWDTAGARS